MSILADLRDAATGGNINTASVIAHCVSLHDAGEQMLAQDLLNASLSFRSAYRIGQYHDLCLTKARLQLDTSSAADAELALEAISTDTNFSRSHRVEALLCLAESKSAKGSCEAGAAVLLAPPQRQHDDIYNDVRVILALIGYLNMSSDFTTALNYSKDLLKSNQYDDEVQLQVRIQHAWTLTNIGLFSDSDEVLRGSHHLRGTNDPAFRIHHAWNLVGADGLTFSEAIRKNNPATFNKQTLEMSGHWLARFHRAWDAFVEGSYSEALQLFNDLPVSHKIEPGLNATRAELILHGVAHTLLEVEDDTAALDAFERLASFESESPLRSRFWKISAVHSYGLLASELNSRSALNAVSTALHRAQLSLGLGSPVVPRLMDVQAELLTADRRFDDSNTVRAVALELLDNCDGYTPQDKLAHELGLCINAFYSHDKFGSLEHLQALILRLTKELGWNSRKTIIARSLLFTHSNPDPDYVSEKANFEELFRDLTLSFGWTNPLTLRTQYAHAQRLRSMGRFDEALSLLTKTKNNLSGLPRHNTLGIRIDLCIGECLRGLNRYREAQTAFESAYACLKDSREASDHQILEIQLSIHECMSLTGVFGPPMKFFAATAAELRKAKREETKEYQQAVLGYASCLEHLGNHSGAAHNYNHIVRQLDRGIKLTAPGSHCNVYVAAAWNDELSKNYVRAISLYENALENLSKSTSFSMKERIDLEHRLLCCKDAIEFA